MSSIGSITSAGSSPITSGNLQQSSNSSAVGNGSACQGLGQDSICHSGKSSHGQKSQGSQSPDAAQGQGGQDEMVQALLKMIEQMMSQGQGGSQTGAGTSGTPQSSTVQTS